MAADSGPANGTTATKQALISNGKDIESKDIDAKLGRLQDLLKMAKGN